MQVEEIKTLKKGVVFEGWGTSLSWFANGINTDDTTKDYLCKLLFEKDNADGLQLNIIRYNIGGCDGTEVGFREGGKVRGFYGVDKTEWNTIDTFQRYFLKKGKELGVTKFEAFSNSPPKAMCISGDTQGNKNRFRDNLKAESIDKFTEYLVDVTRYLIDNDKVPFTSVSPINEPSSPGWVPGSSQEGCFYNFFGTRRKVMSSLKKEITKQNLNITVAGCEENNMLQALIGIIFQPFSWKYTDRFNVHRYTIGDALHFDTHGIEDSNVVRKYINYTMSKICKKSIWMSEWGCTFPPGITNYQDIANVVHFADSLMDDIINLGCSAWIYWQVIENNNGKINDIIYGAQYRAFQHFTHFIKENDTILEIPVSKNKDIKWIGSSNDLCTNIIILSKSAEDILLNLNLKSVDIDIMQTTGNSSEIVTTNLHTNSTNNIIIKGMSLMSIRCKILQI
jgi:O-glycosyl hydrolase